MVTSAQVSSALPLYEALQSLATTLAALNAANGNNSILGFDVKIGDANFNPQGTISISVPIPVVSAETLFGAMITNLQALQTGYSNQMATI